MVVVTRNAPRRRTIPVADPGEDRRIEAKWRCTIERHGVVANGALEGIPHDSRDRTRRRFSDILTTLPLAQYLNFDLTELTQLV